MQFQSSSHVPLPMLFVPGKDQSIQDAGRTAGILLRETGRFFMRGGALVEVLCENDGEPYLRPIKSTQLASEMELVAQIVKIKSDEVELTVLNAVNNLPDELKTAILLRELVGLSYAEIAKVMHCPLGTIRSRIFRAREIIDEQLNPVLDKK